MNGLAESFNNFQEVVNKINLLAGNEWRVTQCESCKRIKSCDKIESLSWDGDEITHRYLCRDCQKGPEDEF